MIKVTEAEWNKIPNDYKGKWESWILNWRDDVPKEWIGKRTVLANCIEKNGGCVLLTEGIHFIIEG